MLDHGQGPARVAVDDDGDIAVAFAHGGLIDQQHSAALAAAMLRDQPRPGPNGRYLLSPELRQVVHSDRTSAARSFIEIVHIGSQIPVVSSRNTGVAEPRNVVAQLL